METNELELNQWAHELLGNCWHDFNWNELQGYFQCSKCGLLKNRIIKPKPCEFDYCSSLDLAAKVIEKAVDGINIHYSTYQDVLLDIIKKDYDPDEWLILNNGYLTHLMITAPALTRVKAAKRAVENKI